MQGQFFVNNYLSAFNQTQASNLDSLTCPVGILLMLTTLLGSGAPRGRTASQIASALNISSTPSDVVSQKLARDMFQDIYSSFKQETNETKKQGLPNAPVAVGIFTKENLTIKRRFRYTLKTYFNATFEQVNFKDGITTMKRINKWANDNTAGLISQVIPSPSYLSPETALMLINTFVFKENWASTFTKTYNGVFHSSPKSQTSLQMMSIEESMLYFRSDNLGYSVISKPFHNSRFSFIVVLPNTPFDLHAIDRMLYGTQSIKRVLESHADHRLVSLDLPKFHLLVESKLKPVAEKLGMRDMFQGGVANFSGITDSEKLHVSVLNQATMLRADEFGVQAAAVTYAAFVPRSFQESVRFVVNQPFGCIIYDQLLDMPLVVARIIKPVQ